MLQVLEERNIPELEVLPVASERSKGNNITYAGKRYEVITPSQLEGEEVAYALLSAGSAFALEAAPALAARGIICIDNSSAFRMDEDVPLVVPAVNPQALELIPRGIIANPNCSTIQLVVVLQALSVAFGLERVVVTTFQAVSGSGYAALQQLAGEGEGREVRKVYPHPIYNNVLPHIDVFEGDGYTKEEHKIMNETRKILSLHQLLITATAVRVPIEHSHSISLNVQLSHDADLEDIRGAIKEQPLLVLEDNPEENLYPQPLSATDKDEVFVGRIRRDTSAPNSFNLWVVADNLRRGAASNSVDILQKLISTK